MSGASLKRLLQAQWGALTQVRMLDFVFLTFLPQRNHHVWCLERQADPVRVPGALRGAPHLPARLLLLPAHTAVAFTPRFYLSVAQRLKWECNRLCWARGGSAPRPSAVLLQAGSSVSSQKPPVPPGSRTWWPCTTDSPRGESILHGV